MDAPNVIYVGICISILYGSIIPSAALKTYGHQTWSKLPSLRQVQVAETWGYEGTSRTMEGVAGCGQSRDGVVGVASGLEYGLTSYKLMC